MARVEPAGIRVHFPRRRLVGRRVLSASALRDDATVPGAVLRALRRGSGAARVASAAASRRVRRRDSRLRGAARGLYPAASAGKRIRVRSRAERPRVLRVLRRRGRRDRRSRSRVAAAAGGILRRAVGGVRDARGPARGGRELDRGGVGARRSGARLDRRPLESPPGPAVGARTSVPGRLHGGRRAVVGRLARTGPGTPVGGAVRPRFGLVPASPRGSEPADPPDARPHPNPRRGGDPADVPAVLDRAA